jgi:hypothetical protein
VNLYTIAYPNQAGFGNVYLGIPCTGNGDCTAMPNSAYTFGIGYRGNQGFSNYNGLTNRIALRNFLGSGVDMTVNYTWSHAIDNMSSTFFEAGGQGIVSQFGNQNNTINNGDFVVGLLDPYKPGLDKGDAEFDVRHRVVLAGNWLIPSGRFSGIAKSILGGWSLNPIFNAHTGQPFSVFDSATNLPLQDATARASFSGPVPTTGNGLIATGLPDAYQYITFNPNSIVTPNFAFTPGWNWPSSMTGRDRFRGPGWWDFDLGISKTTQVREHLGLQIRAEAFNLFNHANLYAEGTTADVGTQNFVSGCYGCTGSTFDRRNLQLGAKVIF